MISVGHKWREKAETIAATTLQTIDFSTLMPEHAVALWTHVITGVNNGMAGTGVDRYLGKLGTGVFLDMLCDELRALLEFIYSRYGGAAPATTDLTWPLPFHLLNILIPDLTAGGVFPEVGLSSSTFKIWQIFLNAANSSAGTATLGWIKSYREPTHIPYLVSHAVTGLSAGVNNQPYKLPWQFLPTAGFIIKGFGATQFTRIKLMIPDDDGVAREQFDMTRDQILQLAQPYSANAITDPMVIGFGKTLVIKPNSYMLIDGGAGIAGTERFCPLQFIPVNAGIPGLPAQPAITPGQSK